MAWYFVVLTKFGAYISILRGSKEFFLVSGKCVLLAATVSRDRSSLLHAFWIDISGQVFNKNYTQYLPLSVYDLMTWVGSPAIYVVDCSHAGLVLTALSHFAVQLGQEASNAAAAAFTDGRSGRAPSAGMDNWLKIGQAVVSIRMAVRTSHSR